MATGKRTRAKNSADPWHTRHARIIGDLIIVNAEGMDRKMIRRLATECISLMRSLSVIENNK